MTTHSDHRELIWTLVISFGLTICFAVWFCGPYKWIAQLQSNYLFDDMYYPLVTGGLVFILLLFPCAPIVYYGLKLIKNK